MEKGKKEGLNISVKSFVTAIIVIFTLMVATYVLTLVIPGGVYNRIEDAEGNLIVDTNGFAYVEGGIPFWKWILSPILVLGASGNTALIAVIIFLLVIGGVFSCLEKCGLVVYMLGKLTKRFGKVRYGLLAIISLFFMSLGSLVGSFEECVPLVPIVIVLSISLGWDVLTGVGMSLLAVGCGFAAGVCNPFTVGVAQQLANLPMFSGIWLRLLSFICIYAVLFTFLYLHAKKVEKPIVQSVTDGFTSDPKMDKASLCFIGILSVGILTIVCSGFIPFLQDYTMIIVAVMFLLAGILSSVLVGMTWGEMGKTAWSGVMGVFPAVIMILMASSIKYTLEEAQVLDTILYGTMKLAADLPKWTVILFIYFIVLIMNFFIPSGSAKAFMLIPLIVPIAQMCGISTQLCIVAFAFGDGFSNVLYPTNPALLISLGLADINYGEWFKWSWKFQAINLFVTAGLLLFGFAVGY